MWLLYLRFDDQGQVVTMHMECSSQRQAKEVLEHAKQHGLTPTARLVEYALFNSTKRIYAHTVPNFHIYSPWEFLEGWKRVEQPAGR